MQKKIIIKRRILKYRVETGLAAMGLELRRVSPKHSKGGQYRVLDGDREIESWGTTLFAIAQQLNVLRVYEEADAELVQETALPRR